MANNGPNITIFFLAALALLAILLLISLHARSPGAIGSPVPIATTNGSYCQYGHICGIKSDGCAVPGAIYNCPAQIISTTNSTTPNEIIAVTLAEELNNSANSGLNLNRSMFYSNSQAGCSRELISACDNNDPQQYICINSQYASKVASQYPKIHPSPQACPMFYMAGNISCGLANNYCVVLDSNS